MDVRTGKITDYACRFLVLATGGAGRLYSVSTNPEVATGDGIAADSGSTGWTGPSAPGGFRASIAAS